MYLPIRNKIFFILALIPLLFATIMMIFNSFFSYRFYLHSQKNKVIKIAKISQSLFENRIFNENSSSLWLKMDDLVENTLLSVVVYDSQNKIVYPRSSQQITSMHKLIIPRTSHHKGPKFPPPDSIKEIKNVNGGILYVTNVFPPFSMPMIGYQTVFYNNYELVILCPLSQIQENVEVTNQLMWIVALVAMILSWFGARFISVQITNPIITLGRETRRLANFETKDSSIEFNFNHNDEVTDLARDIEWLSAQLHAAIAVLAEQNGQLQADVDLGKKNEQIQRRFISSVSHELKSPLFLIQGYAEMLQDFFQKQEKQTVQQSYAMIIVSEAEKMDNLIKTLLDLSQLETGLFRINKSEFAIDLLCADLEQRYRPIFETRKIKFSLAVESATVYADIERVEQILTNYINNALDHITEPNEIELTAKINNNKVIVALYNSGKTIDHEHTEQIWQPFYKVDPSRQRDIGGSGLGLSIVATIQKASHNNYGFYNLEHGVCFWIELDFIPKKLVK